MFKKTVAVLMSLIVSGAVVACGSKEIQKNDVPTNETTSSDTTTNEAETNDTITSDNTTNEVTEESAETITEAVSKINFTVEDTLAEDEEALVATYTDKFDQLTYTDEETGLSITYNLYLPEGYDDTKEYPMVVFIGDSTTAGTDAEYSLTQGLGGLVWATSEWQSVYETIVAVPTYPETILDDHDGYNTTEYVDLTKRFIDYMSQEYAVDTDRIYGTGQSMGCMTTLILASRYPELYAACMFVDGQWDTELLSNLEGQTFVYFAAEDDTNAWTGMQELMSRFDEDNADYSYAQWDGAWSSEELTTAAKELFTDNANTSYFISWASGTIEVTQGNMPMGGGNGGTRPSGEQMKSSETNEATDQNMPAGSNGSVDHDASGEQSGPGGSVAYHMASFDYAYKCIAVMDWLFQQSK